VWVETKGQGDLRDGDAAGPGGFSSGSRIRAIRAIEVVVTKASFFGSVRLDKATS